MRRKPGGGDKFPGKIVVPCAKLVLLHPKCTPFTRQTGKSSSRKILINNKKK
jgi:hypothetical protein